ncbi:anthranilate phosphoribosyltransferase [Clostridium felsineum]|uniref:Anthranilate phosphoribosyltransferase n=1 Tax=Clostridium felsineum TaxID=36839 RepID=A0A1S8M8I7_9CLOT|nr:anthranilate phosphoribosyltransferase [Clostridium felsineum]URZ08240.1 Anthranilate phosphoribosyltransferase [Clostridium felsineum]URZ13271.1 Anthranilate phosphoribosyltransferase [Clostridium felsineum]
MLKDAVKKIIQFDNLSEAEAYDAVNEIMEGRESEIDIAAFLTAFRMKGEEVEEILGCAKAMKDHAPKIHVDDLYTIDTCGTGGDGGKTFNVSTCASIIAAAGGVKIAKHGNRAGSSKSGSADVLKELGINIELEPEEVEEGIREKGMAFIFAQSYHKAMKNVAGVRKSLGFKTIFNLLGPLTNPCNIKGQVLGVFDQKLAHPIAEVLLKFGRERALVLNGCDGLDEITTTGFTFISEIKDGKIKDYIIRPEDFGIKRSIIEDISGGTPKENAEIIINILKGEKGHKRDIVVLNTAAALYVGKVCESLKDGTRMAQKLIDSGAALRKYEELK